jgi:hypothetical protein
LFQFTGVYDFLAYRDKREVVSDKSRSCDHNKPLDEKLEKQK